MYYIYKDISLADILQASHLNELDLVRKAHSSHSYGEADELRKIKSASIVAFNALNCLVFTLCHMIETINQILSSISPKYLDWSNVNKIIPIGFGWNFAISNWFEAIYFEKRCMQLRYYREREREWEKELYCSFSPNGYIFE